MSGKKSPSIGKVEFVTEPQPSQYGQHSNPGSPPLLQLRSSLCPKTPAAPRPLINSALPLKASVPSFPPGTYWKEHGLGSQSDLDLTPGLSPFELRAFELDMLEPRFPHL